MNKWFNIKRFWLVLRHELADSWIELAIYTAIFGVSFLVPCVFEYDINNHNAILAAYIIIVGLVIYYWVTASRQFANIQRPEQRISYLTLPASNAEKFYARLIIFWVLPTSLWLLSVLPANIDHRFIYIFISLITLESSLAVLFGTIFRRFGFLVLNLVEVVITVSLVAYFSVNWQAFANLDFSIIACMAEYVGTTDPDWSRMAKLVICITSVPTVLNIALARIIFSRKQFRRPLVNTEI